MSRKETRKNKKKIMIILAIICIILVVGGGIVFAWKYMNPEKTQEVSNNEEIPMEEPEPEPEKEIQIYSGNNRPIAFMVDNHSDAWPQFSINDAYMVYEIIVEGGETRLMPVFKSKDADQVGPMRSSRHYFLDYALENDAIYAHIGWSPQAQSDISSLGINNINGLEYDTGRAYKNGDVFWRISGKYKAPHNSIASTTAVREAAEKKGYNTTSSKDSVLNYVADEFTLEEKEDVVTATDITIPFSTLQKVNFKYDPETQRYTRYARGKLQTDAVSQTNITTKNIIITFVKNYTLTDKENKGRQGIENTGAKKGYYITNGMAIPITCTKESRSSQTVYTDAQGNEINVNDGNTFVEICPIDASVVIE